jgi:hypothetical protein
MLYTVAVNGQSFTVSEALARGVAALLQSSTQEGFAVLAVGADANGEQVRFADFLDSREAYEAVAEAWGAIERAQAPVPARLPEPWRRAPVLDDMLDDCPF